MCFPGFQYILIKTSLNLYLCSQQLNNVYLKQQKHSRPTYWVWHWKLRQQKPVPS